MLVAVDGLTLVDFTIPVDMGITIDFLVAVYTEIFINLRVSVNMRVTVNQFVTMHCQVFIYFGIAVQMGVPANVELAVCRGVALNFYIFIERGVRRKLARSVNRQFVGGIIAKRRIAFYVKAIVNCFRTMNMKISTCFNIVCGFILPSVLMSFVSIFFDFKGVAFVFNPNLFIDSVIVLSVATFPITP